MIFVSMTGKRIQIVEAPIGHCFCNRYMKLAYDVITCHSLFGDIDACANCREIS
jgi:hypothetical protein